MPPLSLNLETIYLVGILLSLIGSFTLTLTKAQFSLLSKQWEDEKEFTPIELKIRQLWRSSHLLEVIALGRLSFTTLTVLFTLLTWPQWFNPINFEWYKAINWILLLPIIFVITFISPNVIAHLKPNSTARSTYFAFYPLYLIFYVPSWLSHKFYWGLLDKFNYQPRFNFLSEDEKKELDLDLERDDENKLEDEEREMIRNIFEFADRSVQEVMTPRVEIISAEVKADLAEVTQLLNHEKPTRIPVYEGSIDQVVGVLYSKDFLEWITQNNNKASFDLQSIIRPAFFVSKSKEIDDLMREFRLTRNHMAIVVDEFGGTAGLVTLEDILEEIVGEIYDEEDFEEKIIEKVKKGSYLVDPIISLNDLERELDIEIPGLGSHDVETLNGLIQSTLQEIPRRGTRIWIEPMDIKVLKVNNRKIKRILISLPAMIEPQDETFMGHA